MSTLKKPSAKPAKAGAKKLKVAVQLYGHLRTYMSCVDYLKRNVLEHYDCDVFMHTWDKLEHSNKSWYEDRVRTDPLAVTDEAVKGLHKLYAPTKLKIETQDAIPALQEEGHFGTHGTIQISLRGMKSMLYSQYQANKLRLEHEQETGAKYDYVVVLRPDILPLAPLEIEVFEKDFAFYAKTSIHLLHNSLIKLKEARFFNYPLLFDCFFIARPQTMTTITGCYEQFDRYFKDFPKTFPEGVENPESAIVEYMLENGVVPRQQRFYYAIKRKNDSDDIVLAPPEMVKQVVEVPEVYQVSRVQHFKNVLKGGVRLFVRRAPKPVRRVVRRGLHMGQRLYEFWDTAEREAR
jgi:hypothetical protein